MAELIPTMNPAVSFNDHLSLLMRDPLAAVKRDGRVIGYVGNDVPVELILAANATPLRVRGAAHEDTPHADLYLEAAFMPELRAVAEQWLRGSLDTLEAIVLSRADDSAQRLYYYMCELQHRGICRGPQPLLYDVAMLSRQTSRAHTLESTRRLAAELGSKGDLDRAMKRVVRREDLLSRISTRRTDTTPLTGSAAWCVEHASGYDWRESFDDAAEAWLNDAPALHNPRRILLAGNSPPDLRLHLAIEASGGSIVSELVESFGPVRSAHADALTGIADRYQQRSNVAVSMRANARWLVECARAARADAVVMWLIEEDESLPWEISRQVQSLRAESVPSLLLSRQQWRATDETLSQLRTFVSGLEGST